MYIIVVFAIVITLLYVIKGAFMNGDRIHFACVDDLLSHTDVGKRIHVNQVACGKEHTIVLSSKGQVCMYVLTYLA